MDHTAGLNRLEQVSVKYNSKNQAVLKCKFWAPKQIFLRWTIFLYSEVKVYSRKKKKSLLTFVSSTSIVGSRKHENANGLLYVVKNNFSKQLSRCIMLSSFPSTYYLVKINSPSQCWLHLARSCSLYMFQCWSYFLLLTVQIYDNKENNFVRNWITKCVQFSINKTSILFNILSIYPSYFPLSSICQLTIESINWGQRPQSKRDG